MFKKFFKNISLAVAIMMIVTSCAVTDIDRSVDFSSYKSFSWGTSEIVAKNPVYNSDLISRNIKSTIENEFAKRGIVQDKKNPDFLVSFKTFTEEKLTTTGGNAFYGAYPFPLRFYPMGFGWGWPMYGSFSSPRSYEYTEGTLIVDVKDTRNDELIWRGVVSGNVDNAKKLQKQIQKGIRAIMKKYPVNIQEEEKLILPDNDVNS